MTTLVSMVRRFSTLNFYNLGDSLTRREIAVYAEEIQRLFEDLDKILKENFIQTADSYGLLEKEKLYGQGSEGLSVYNRRQMLLKRTAEKDNRFTKTKIEEFIQSLGVEFKLYENPALYTVTVQITDSLYTQEQGRFIDEQIKSIIPAHLNCEVYFGGKTWEQLSTENETWFEKDYKNESWKDINVSL